MQTTGSTYDTAQSTPVSTNPVLVPPLSPHRPHAPNKPFRRRKWRGTLDFSTESYALSSTLTPGAVYSLRGL
jgi:hypothetical protein